MTTLHGPSVYVRDLFDDAGPSADLFLGPGPDPGGRIIVESAQLNAIARQFNVPWRSVSRADRAVLEWPGRPLRQEEILDAVHLAVTAIGVTDRSDVEIAGFSPPTIPVEVTPVPTVSQLDYDPGTGRFTAALDLTAEGMNPIHTRISGLISEMTEAPVALTRLLTDTVVRADDLRMARVRSGLIHNEIARSVDQVVGMQLRHAVQAGQPLKLADLMRPPLVQRGAIVRMELDTAGVSITGQATALDTGSEGDRIRVQNLNSHALLSAEIIGPGQVRVTPDAPPGLPTAQARYDRARSDNR
jgi:flagella basal body P-ring formation protein FlgA